MWVAETRAQRQDLLARNKFGKPGDQIIESRIGINTMLDGDEFDAEHTPQALSQAAADGLVEMG